MQTQTMPFMLYQSGRQNNLDLQLTLILLNRTILTCTLQTKRQRFSFHLRYRKMNENTRTSSYLHIDLETIYFLKRRLPLLVYIT